MVNIYKKYKDLIPLILKILELQGKGQLIKLVKNNSISFEDLLLSDQYYLTNLDISLISLYFNIPIILLSSTNLIENNKGYLVVNSTNNKDFYFIKTPGVRTEGYPVQKLLYTTSSMIINIDTLTDKFKNNIQEDINNNFIDEYIDSFKKKIKKLVILD